MHACCWDRGRDARNARIHATGPRRHAALLVLVLSLLALAAPGLPIVASGVTDATGARYASSRLVVRTVSREPYRRHSNADHDCAPPADPREVPADVNIAAPRCHCERERENRNARIHATGPRRHAALLVLVFSLLALAVPGLPIVASGVAGAASSVVLQAPASGSPLSNVARAVATDAEIAGSVGGAGLTRWVLDAGSGEAPASWTGIAEGTAPVSGGLLGVWHTGALANGPYTLRLQAWNAAGRRSESRVGVTVANFSLRQDRIELDTASGSAVTYTSVVPFPLTETLAIKDKDCRVVRTLANAARPAGTYADAWEGRDDAGAHLPDGPYFVVATVSDGTHSMAWDQRHEFLDNYFDSKDALEIAPFDPFDNRPLAVTYTSPVAGNVTISLFNKSLAAHRAPENAGDGAPAPRALGQCVHAGVASTPIAHVP